jgi:formate-dependent nitrite reductase membrane component NrfD
MKSVYWFALLSASAPVLIQMTSQLQADGAAKVMAYRWGDWLILGAVSFALMVSNLLSFFSTKWSEHKKEVDATKTGARDVVVQPPATVTVETPAKTETTIVSKP